VDTRAGLVKFIRILRSGGVLILVFPDQKKYEAHCIKTGQPLNPHHVHADMGLRFMLDRLDEIKAISYQVLMKSDCEIDYNVILAVRIKKI
jgi:hypothetical protein